MTGFIKASHRLKVTPKNILEIAFAQQSTNFRTKFLEQAKDSESDIGRSLWTASKEKSYPNKGFMQARRPEYSHFYEYKTRSIL